MKRGMRLLGKVALSSMLLVTIILFNSCKKEGIAPPPPTTKEDKTPLQERPGLFIIDFDGLRSDGGFSYKIGYEIDPGDSNDNHETSKLRLFENGVELHPPHTQHQDIRDYGKGRFSHWGTTLYFSTSDNTDPVANGRKYTYTLDGSGYSATAPTN
jgi:pectate lyase